MEYDDDEEFFLDLLENGYIEMVMFDERTGEPVYKMTKKMIEEFPEVFQEHMSFTNELVFSVWQKGFLEVTMLDDGSWNILPNEKTKVFRDYEDELTNEEWTLMAEINDFLHNRGTI